MVWGKIWIEVLEDFRPTESLRRKKRRRRRREDEYFVRLQSTVNPSCITKTNRDSVFAS